MNILFVGTRNESRSAAAEVVLRKMLSDEAINGVEVASCGTSARKELERDDVMCRLAAKLGYLIEGNAVPINELLLDSADLIIVMTSRIEDEVKKLLRTDHWDRICLFNEYCFGETTDLYDPYYRPEFIYWRRLKRIIEGCKIMISKISLIETKGDAQFDPFTIRNNVFFECPSSFEGKVTVNNGVTFIAERAFWFCHDVKEVELPHSLNGIGMYAFAYSGLKQINIPGNCLHIAEGAFCSCHNLKEIDFPEGLLTLKENILCECIGMERVGIPDTLREIRDSAFSGCRKLASVSLPSCLKRLEERAFIGCVSLKEIRVPDNCNHLGYGVFIDCASLRHVKLPDKLESISSSLFKGCCSLEEVEFPENLRIVCSEAFKNCTSLEGISLPRSVVEIRESAFEGCVNLQYVRMPADTAIHKDAFKGCPNMTIETYPD